MADLLIHANAAATAAAPPAEPRLGEEQMAKITAWYRGAVAKGITGNQGKRRKTAKDGLRLARRFRDHQDMILRFATDLAVGFTSNQAERDVRPSRSSSEPPAGAGAPSTASPTSRSSNPDLSTAAKWGLSKLDALRQLFSNRNVAPPPRPAITSDWIASG